MEHRFCDLQKRSFKGNIEFEADSLLKALMAKNLALVLQILHIFLGLTIKFDCKIQDDEIKTKSFHERPRKKGR